MAEQNGEHQDIELVKHRYRIREVLIDKGVLAVIVGVLAVLANARLQAYKSGLDTRLESYKSSLELQLDEFRASREKQRVLAEREIDAHEKVWKALVGLRRFLGPKLDSSFDEATEREFNQQIFQFTQVVEEESVYLDRPLHDRLGSFVDPVLADFRVNWELAPNSVMSKSLWDGISNEIDTLGQQIRATIYARRGKADSARSDASSNPVG
jgi:hypothetical protein